MTIFAEAEGAMVVTLEKVIHVPRKRGRPLLVNLTCF